MWFPMVLGGLILGIVFYNLFFSEEFEENMEDVLWEESSFKLGIFVGILFVLLLMIEAVYEHYDDIKVGPLSVLLVLSLAVAAVVCLLFRISVFLLNKFQ